MAPMKTDEPIIIAGGGIGGLAAAGALQSRGFRILVLERTSSLSAAGAGLAIQPNGITALRCLGLGDAVSREGVEIERASVLDHKGRRLSDLTLRDVRADAGAPMMAMLRSRLLQVLHGGVEAPLIRWGATVRSFDDGDDGVDVRLETHDDQRGQALVGCDGIDSAIRQVLLKDGPPRYAGYTSWRGLCPRGGLSIENSLIEIWGRGQRFGFVPVSETEVYWFAVANRRERDPDPETDAASLIAPVFENWCAPVPCLIENTPAERIIRTDIRDRTPVRRWGRGRVTLLGDAAHPTTPDLGQGASLAIEDAVVLADRLARVNSIAEGLRNYERARLSRTARIVRLSRRFGTIAQLDGALACRMRNALVRVTPASVTRRTSLGLWRFEPPAAT